MTFNRALFSSASGDWETPQELFDALNEEFHFTLDACATRENALCPVFYSEDSLTRPWYNNVYCNPPYGRQIGEWVRKGCLATSCFEARVVVMLLPARTDTRWWHDWVMKADEIRFIRGRLKFSGHKNSAPFPSCIVVFRSPLEGV